MKGQITYEDLVKPGIIERLISELKQVKDLVSKNPLGDGKDVKEYNKNLEDTVNINDDLLRLLSDKIVLQNELKKAQDNYDKAVTKDSASALKYAKIIEKTKENLSKMGYQIKNVTKLTNAENGSYEHKSLILAKLRMSIRKLDQTDKANQKTIVKKTKQIQKLDKELKKFDASIGNHQRNVGNYSGALGDAMGQMGLMTGVLPKLKTGLDLVKMGFISVKSALISTGIGALVVALGSLYAFFTSTSEGALKLKKALLPLTETFKLMWDMLSDFGQLLFNVFASPVESLKDLIKEIKPFVDVVVGAWKIMTGVMEKNTAKIAEGALQYGSGLEESAKKVKSAYSSFGDYMDKNYEKLKRNITEANQLLQGEYDLQVKTKDFTIQKARLDVKIAQDRLLAQENQYKNAELAIIAQNRAIENTKKLYALEKELAQEEYNIAKSRLVMHKSTLEEQQAVEDMKAGLIKLDEEQANGLRKLTSLLNTFTQTANAQQREFMRASQEIIIGLTEAEDIANTNRIKGEIDTYKKLQDIRDDDKDKYLQGLDDKQEILDKALEIGFLSQEEYVERSIKLNTDYNDYLIKKELEKQAVIASSTGQLIGALGDLGEAMGASAEQIKAIRIAEAIINTYAGVAGALALGPPQGLILAGVQLIAGLATVATIANTNVPKFAEGTEYLQLDGRPRGTDTIPIMANEGERIVPTDVNRFLMGVKNNELPGLVMIGKAVHGGLVGNFGDVVDKIDKTNKLLSGWKFVSPSGEVIDLEGNKVSYV